MMDQWTDEQRHFWLEHKAQNHTIKQTIAHFEETFPGARCYTEGSIRQWFKSKECKAEYKQSERIVRKQARSYSFANKDQRLLAYIEVCEKILAEVRVMEADNKQFPVLTRELRENFKFIKEEVDPFGIEDEQTRSAFETFTKRLVGTPFESIVVAQVESTPRISGN